MDVRNLSFQPESFDVAIDKGASYLNPMLNTLIVTFGRNNGCHDDSQGGCLGKSKRFICNNTSIIMESRRILLSRSLIIVRKKWMKH